MKDCMLDLETLGRDADAVVMQIGLCRFDIWTGEVDPEGFEVNIDINDSLRRGFRADGSTIEWWLRQDTAAQYAVVADPKYPVKKALKMASEYVGDCKLLWSHTFDITILSYHFRKVNLKLPVHYRNHRDIRTLMCLAGWSKFDYETFGMPCLRHTALADCKNQIRYAHECFKRIKGGSLR